jgi:hypothetical protein
MRRQFPVARRAQAVAVEAIGFRPPRPESKSGRRPSGRKPAGPRVTHSAFSQHAVRAFDDAIARDDLKAARAAHAAVHAAHAEGVRVTALTARREVTLASMSVRDLEACAQLCRADIATTRAELLTLRLIVASGQNEAEVCRQRIPLGERRLACLQEELAGYRAELARRERMPN